MKELLTLPKCRNSSLTRRTDVYLREVQADDLKSKDPALKSACG